eukprot:1070174-Prorocentrum_lima.AAC.1
MVLLMHTNSPHRMTLSTLPQSLLDLELNNTYSSAMVCATSWLTDNRLPGLMVSEDEERWKLPCDASMLPYITDSFAFPLNEEW